MRRGVGLGNLVEGLIPASTGAIPKKERIATLLLARAKGNGCGKRLIRMLEDSPVSVRMVDTAAERRQPPLELRTSVPSLWTRWRCWARVRPETLPDPIRTERSFLVFRCVLYQNFMV